MFAWWDDLTTFQQVLYYISIPATLVLLIQTALTFLGLGDDVEAEADFGDIEVADDVEIGGDIEGDFDVDFDSDLEISFQMFTFRNFIAFFTFFGWGGLWAYSVIASELVSIIIALGCGLLAMAVSASFFYFMQKMTQSGNMKITNALGKVADVYLVIPPMREGYGKVNVVVQGALREIEAVTDSEESISTGRKVHIVGVLNQTTVIFKEVNE